MPMITLVPSEKKNGRVLVDFTGKKPRASIGGGSQYGIMFCCDAARMSREYFAKLKSEAPDKLVQYIG